MTENKHVQKHHLERKAFLYVRQSSMKQVLENVESTKRQYALKRSRSDGLTSESSSSTRTRASPARPRRGERASSNSLPRSASDTLAS